MDGLQWKTLLKWMIWGYHYFWKPPHLPPPPRFFHFSLLQVTKKVGDNIEVLRISDKATL